MPTKSSPFYVEAIRAAAFDGFVALDTRAKNITRVLEDAYVAVKDDPAQRIKFQQFLDEMMPQTMRDAFPNGVSRNDNKNPEYNYDASVLARMEGLRTLLAREKAPVNYADEFRNCAKNISAPETRVLVMQSRINLFFKQARSTHAREQLSTFLNQDAGGIVNEMLNETDRGKVAMHIVKMQKRLPQHFEPK